MRWLELLVAASPEQAVLPPTADATVSIPVEVRSQCDTRLYQTRGSRPEIRRLDQSDGSVRMYYLVENRVNGCSMPVIAIEHLPEADRARGREINPGRSAQPER